MRWCYNCVQRPHSDSCCSLVAVSGRKVVYSRSRPRKSCRSCTRQIVWTHSICPVDLSSRNYAHKWCGRKSPRADSVAPSWPSGAAVVSAATKRWREEESGHGYGQGSYISFIPNHSLNWDPTNSRLGPSCYLVHIYISRSHSNNKYNDLRAMIEVLAVCQYKS